MTRLARSSSARMLLLMAGLCGGVSWAAPPVEPAMHVLRTVPGDTLIGIAARHLRDPSQWRELARVNRLRNPNLIGSHVDLRIPLALMRVEPAPAAVVEVTGQVRSDTATALQPGAAMPQGSVIDTGTDGHITLRLVDGTRLRLRPESRLTLTESGRIVNTPAVQSGVRLDRGRVEAETPPARGGRPSFRIGTPGAVLGVRGTGFRVASDASGTRGEVLEGVVAVEGKGNAQHVTAGFGTVVDDMGRVAAPVALLAAPDIRALPTLLEQIVVRFDLPAAAGAQRWRGQIATDAGFDEVLADLTSATNELRFVDLPDGDYILRVRAIDARHLEGRDAEHRFRLKARPEPPLPSSPAPDAVLFGNAVDFTWAASEQAATYRLQVATDDTFATPLRDLPDLGEPSARIEGLPPGAYHWRLRSVRGDGDAGPWRAPRRFEVRPMPPTPPPPSTSGNAVSFSWDRGIARQWDFEVARDAGFADVVSSRRLDEPTITLPEPAAGRYFVRLRTHDADGFVSPWGAVQHFDVQSCVRDGSGVCVGAGSGRLIHTP